MSTTTPMAVRIPRLSAPMRRGFALPAVGRSSDGVRWLLHAASCAELGSGERCAGCKPFECLWQSAHVYVRRPGAEEWTRAPMRAHSLRTATIVAIELARGLLEC